MRIPIHALGAAAAIALLAGCGVGSHSAVVPTGAGQMAVQHPFGMPNVVTTNSVLAPGVRIPAPSQTHGVSFNTCTTAALLFVSDASNNVIDIYDNAHENAVSCGQISGNNLSQPQGIDVDGNGNLYVANTNLSQILEFKPPYTGAPSKTMNDSGQYPAGVEADCGTKIWVTNIINTSGGAGSISDYSLSGTSPLHTYSDANAAREYFPTCDPNGNVYTTMSDFNGAAHVNKFRKSLSYSAIDLTKPVNYQFPGGIDWEGSQTTGFLYIDDQIGKTIQRCAHGTGSCAVRINMTTAGDPVTFDITAADDDLFTADATNVSSQVWDLGGAFDNTVTSTGLPIGAALYPDDNT